MKDPGKESSENILWKGENALTNIFYMSHNFYSSLSLQFQPQLDYCLYQ